MAGARNGRRPSDRPVSATEVARIAGVSQKTVSRVVNDDRHVSDAVRERVQAAIATLGYRPTRAARSLVLGRYRAIGMLALGTMDYGPASLTVGSEGGIHGGCQIAWTKSGVRVPPITGPAELFDRLSHLLRIEPIFLFVEELPAPSLLVCSRPMLDVFHVC